MSRSKSRRDKHKRWRGMSTSALRDFIRINQATVNRLQADVHWACQELKQRGDTSEQSADASADATA